MINHNKRKAPERSQTDFTVLMIRSVVFIAQTATQTKVNVFQIKGV